MPVNHVMESVFGTAGAICWTVQLLPQIWKSWREHSTHGLSRWLMLTWGAAGAFLGTYVIVQKLNIPLIIQPHLFAFLAFVSWGQCLYHGQGHSKVSATLLALTAMATAGALEAGMIYAIRPSYEKGNDAGVLFLGIASSVILAGGLLPQFWEIYKFGEVIGVSCLFMFVDMLGGIFSDLSLLFNGHVDTLAAVAYTLVAVMDAAILFLALLLNPRAARRRSQEAKDNVLVENHGNNKEGKSKPPTASPSKILESWLITDEDPRKRTGSIGTGPTTNRASEHHADRK